MRSQLLQLAIPLVKTHGFTRGTLSLSVLSLPKPHREPLSDRAVSALFGQASDAQRTLINAWLDHAREQMKHEAISSPSPPTLGGLLGRRLKKNEEVLQYLPEAFALLAAPNPAILPIDPRPGIDHAFKISDDACYISGDASICPSWHARRTSIAAAYAAAELHQLNSPQTAVEFLNSLLDVNSRIHSSVENFGQFTSYVGRSWVGIIKSFGLL